MANSATSASASHGAEGTRRDFLFLTAGAFGAVGAALSLWPFINSMNPSADVLALSTVEVDISPIAEGQRITVAWRGQPVFVDHRTADQIKSAREVSIGELRDQESDQARVKKPEWLVVIGICTHLGCVPLGQKPTDPKGDYGGWFCPCHGSQYDTSGRIRRGPAPQNLHVPPYAFINDKTIRIG